MGIAWGDNPSYIAPARAVGPYALIHESLIVTIISIVKSSAKFCFGERITQSSLNKPATVTDSFERSFKVALLFDSVKERQDIAATVSSVVDESSNNAVAAVAAANDILPPQRHLKLHARR
jgi:hypothetical protein